MIIFGCALALFLIAAFFAFGGFGFLMVAWAIFGLYKLTKGNDTWLMVLVFLVVFIALIS